MSLILNGTTGISDVDGSASTPALTGTDSNTGIFFPAADTIAFAEGGAEVMRIDSSGNVGIGTSSPAGKLGINGDVTIGVTTANQKLFIFNGDTTNQQQLRLDMSGTDGRVFVTRASGTPANLLFGTEGTERMRINSSGNLLVGTTSGVASVGRLQSVQADQSNAGLSVDATNANYDYNLVYLNTARAASSGFNFIQATTSNYGTVQFRVRGDGNVYNATGVYSTLSDIKLKDNITDATSKLEKLNQVRVVNYNLKDSELKQIGFIAQELEQIFPSLVEDNIDKDVSGNDLGTVTKSVKLTVFIPILVKAIQEQQAIITDLKARIETLESK